MTSHKCNEIVLLLENNKMLQNKNAEKTFRVRVRVRVRVRG